MRPSALPILVVALALAACGSASPSASSSSTSVTATSAPAHTTSDVPGPPRPWAELTGDERRAHMTREVLPRMTDLFVAYDAERYDAFTCATCHGDDAAERGYAMPNPSLVPLYPTGSEGQHQTVRDYPEGVRFMYNRVLPTMQALLGAAAYDERTGEGFTCYACHPHAE